MPTNKEFALYGLDINTKIIANCTLLTYASHIEDEDAVKLLLNNGADPSAMDNNSHTPLVISAKNGNASITKLLIDNGADAKETDIDGQPALNHAALSGSNETVKLLLEHGALVNEKDPFYQRSPLATAVGAPNTEIIKTLLANGADVTAKTRTGKTVLYIAENTGVTENISLIKDALEAQKQAPQNNNSLSNLKP